MLIYAGLDEAGYGPMLGPLCVAATSFIIHDATTGGDPPDLWTRLSSVICREKRDGRKRVAIDDSKKLKGANGGRTHPLLHLERGVLAFLGACADVPEDDAGFFAAVGASTPSEPWMTTTTALPLTQDLMTLRMQVNRVRRAMSSAGIELGLMRCEMIEPGRFNDQVERMGSKSIVNMGAMIRLIELIRTSWPDAEPTIVADRQGGRVRYYEELRAAWPTSRIRVEVERPEESRYSVTVDGQRLSIRFLREAEACHAPVALASMLAKYTRELAMIRLNRFFCDQVPDLAPTAGYVADARRYLTEIEPVLRSFGIDRRKLARSV